MLLPVIISIIAFPILFLSFIIEFVIYFNTVFVISMSNKTLFLFSVLSKIVIEHLSNLKLTSIKLL